MKVTQMTVSSFRNYRHETVSFCDGLNIIEGLNTAGKTNLVEAVYLCSLGKSPRTSRDKELIRIGDQEAHITLTVAKKHRNHRIDLHIMPDGSKRIAIDGVGISKMADLMGVLNVIFFSPDELRIVKEDPGERRRFINITLCQQNKNYFQTLAKYNHILEQRNRILKDAKSLDDVRASLPIWDAQLASCGARLILWRRDLLASLSSIADGIHRAIAGSHADLTLTYETQAAGETAEEIEQALLTRLTEYVAKDYNVHYTLVGPHRDDFSIVSEGKELRVFGSQGQQRTAALALKLACISYFEQSTGEKPVLLLDDVLSELDASRREALLSATDGIQTMLTCTEYKDDDTYVEQRIHVVKGSIVKE